MTNLFNSIPYSFLIFTIGTTFIYSEDDTWNAGHVVRDPNYGLMPHAYYIDNDENGQFYYTIENLDETLSSQFLIDMKYKALT